jgi:hypothetical protein
MRQQQGTELMAMGGGRDLALGGGSGGAGPDVLDLSVPAGAGDGNGGQQANLLHKLNLLL